MTHSAAQQDRDNLLAHPEDYTALEDDFEDLRTSNTSRHDLDRIHDNMCSLADEALRIYAEEDLIEATPTSLDNNT
eukprot:6991866-Ditylum_brightwellii.AAC.1